MRSSAAPVPAVHLQRYVCPVTDARCVVCTLLYSVPHHAAGVSVSVQSAAVGGGG
jgi:hypothetical protein